MVSTCQPGTYVVNIELAGRDCGLYHVCDLASFEARMKNMEAVAAKTFADEIKTAGSLVNFLIQFVVSGAVSGSLFAKPAMRKMGGEMAQLYLWRSLRDPKLFAEGNLLTLMLVPTGSTYAAEVRMRRLPLDAGKVSLTA